MYYEEKIVNGVLCYRGTPDGEWTPLTIKELSGRAVRLTTLEAAVGRLPKLEGAVMISPFDNTMVVLEFADGMPELADCYTKELADALASLLRLRQEAP